MCAPVAAMTALAVASSAASVYSQTQSANAQVDAANKQAQQAANQQAYATEAEMGERVKQARAEQAKMTVAAGEAGVGGLSFEAAITDSLLQQNLDLGAIQKQGQFNNAAIKTNLESATAGTRINKVAAGLQVATAGANGYITGKNIEDKVGR